MNINFQNPNIRPLALHRHYIKPTFKADSSKENSVISVYGDNPIRTNPAQLSLFALHDFHGQDIRMERAFSIINQYDRKDFYDNNNFFDKNKLGDNILVRQANEGETIVTLDGQTRNLLTSDIVITDGKKPVCIAGVMGGENTDVDETTKDILIESAIFDSVAIRYTASRLDLRSEASIRYGKGLSYEYTDAAIERACYLLSKYANATVLTGTLKHDIVDKKEKIYYNVKKTVKISAILSEIVIFAS